MRSKLLLLMMLFSIGCSNTKKTSSHMNELRGTWQPIHQEIGGNVLPKAVYEKQQLIIVDSNYTVVAESIDKGVMRYSGIDKMDIYGKDGVNAGKHFRAIYKYENEQLTVCYNLKGDSYPEAFDTKGKPMYFISVFMKAMVK
jgi:uncharacterized protein (TIGR03067 family)